MAYVNYLRSYRDADNRDEVKKLAAPLAVKVIENQLDREFEGLKRTDGTLSTYERFPDNPRAAAACIDWKVSSPALLMMGGRGVAGSPTADVTIESREAIAMGTCQSVRKENSTCSCEIVRRNKQSSVRIPDGWIARHLD